MQPNRMIFEDMPAFIPIPVALQHGRAEVIVWPLDDAVRTDSPETPDPSNRQVATAKSRPIGLAKDRGMPLPDDFFAPLPDELIAAFSGER